MFWNGFLTCVQMEMSSLALKSDFHVKGNAALSPCSAHSSEEQMSALQGLKLYSIFQTFPQSVFSIVLV